jgi:sulfur carrier protein ThiS
MELIIENELTKKKEKVCFSGKDANVKELLLFLKLNPEVVLIVRKDEVLTLDEPLKDKDRITILSVVSGG